MSPSELPKTYKHAIFKEKGGPLVVEEVGMTQPETGEVLVKVEACGVCHSDMFAQHNVFGAGLSVIPFCFYPVVCCFFQGRGGAISPTDYGGG